MTTVTRPDVTPPGQWSFPGPTTTAALPNGLNLLAYDIPGQYVLAVRVVVPLNLASEPAHLEGIANVMARLLDEGTTRHTSEEFAELLERKGIGLGAGMTESALLVEMDVAKRNLDPALDLLAQLLAEPVFPEAEVRRVIAARKAEIEQERASAPHRAGREWIATYFASTERASRPSGGSAQTVEAITREDLVDFHARHIGPSGATIIVAGDLSGVEVEGVATERLGAWTAPQHEPAGPPPTARAAESARRIAVVDRPGSVQTEFAVGCAGPDRRVPVGWAAYQVVSFVVGGSPNARIDAVLREDKGYTYGIRSAFRPRRSGGTFLTSGSVRSEVTVEALGLLLDILDGAASGYTDDEVTSGVDFIGRTAPGRYATSDAVAGEVANLVVDGLPLDFTTTNLRRLEALTSADVEGAAAAYLTGEWTVVIVGDAAAWVDRVRELGRGEVTVVPN